MAGTVSRPVVVAAIGDDSRAAIEAAAAAAVARKASLHVYGRRPAADLTRQVCMTWPGLAVTARPLAGGEADALIEASRTSRLLVVARDIDGRYEGVAGHSHCPTLVVPPRPVAHPDGPVMVGVDITANEEAAIEVAFEEAALRGVPLVAVHVWSGVPRADLSPVDPYVYDLAATANTVDRLLAEALAGWAAKVPDVAIERRLVHQPDTARGLLDATAAAGLVVLGANHAPFSCHLLGMVAGRVLRQTDRPVTVVRLANR